MKLRACWSIFRMQMIDRLQYRAAAWGRLITAFFWGIVSIIIITLFYRYGEDSLGLDGGVIELGQAVSYLWLIQITLNLLPSMGMDGVIREKIRNGDVGLELLRPMDLYFHWFTRAAANRLAPFFLQLIPFTIIVFLLPKGYNLQPPKSIYGLLACILALALGLLLSCATTGILYNMLLKIDWGDGPVYMLFVVIDLLAGAYLPLQLWPSWLQKFLFWQPFAGIMDIPFRFYIGSMEPRLIGLVVLRQLGWTVVISAIGWLWMRRTLKKLVIQGG